MSENLIVDRELEENKVSLTQIADLFKTNKAYQRLIFIILSVCVWGGSLMLVAYPSQKNLPAYTCIPEGRNLTNLTNLQNFTEIAKLPNFLLVDDQACVKKYCYRNLDVEEIAQSNNST